MFTKKRQRDIAKALYEAIIDDRRAYQAVMTQVCDLGSVFRLQWRMDDRILEAGVEVRKDKFLDHAFLKASIGQPVEVVRDDQNRVTSLKINGISVISPGV